MRCRCRAAVLATVCVLLVLLEGLELGYRQPVSLPASPTPPFARQLSMVLPLGPAERNADHGRLALLLHSLAKFFTLADLAVLLLVTPDVAAARRLLDSVVEDAQKGSTSTAVAQRLRKVGFPGLAGSVPQNCATWPHCVVVVVTENPYQRPELPRFGLTLCNLCSAAGGGEGQVRGRRRSGAGAGAGADQARA